MLCTLHEQRIPLNLNELHWIWLPPAAAFAAWSGLKWLRKELTPSPLEHPPAPSGIAECIERVTIPTHNRKTLFAQWIHPCPSGPDAQAVASGIAILMHGWGGNGSQLMPAARALHRQGWHVLLPDARSHGQSESDTFSSLPRFAEDISATLDWARHTITDARLPVLVLGHSLGGAAALLCASQRSDIQAVISVSAFAHPEQVMRRWLAEYRIPFWPLGWLANRYIERVIGHRFSAIAPVECIRKINSKVLIVHGENDTVVPVECACRLQQASVSARLLRVPGTHEHFDNEAQLYRTMADWLQETGVINPDTAAKEALTVAPYPFA